MPSAKQAAAQPPARSSLTCSPGARARAISVWTSGTFIGLFIGFAAGGVLAHHYGWRFAVIATAIPGIIFALLLLLTVKEPARGASEEVGHVPQERATLRETVQFMRQQRGYLYLLVCFLTCAFVNYSFATWVPAVLTRVHHMGGSEVGLYSGFFKGFCGFAGILAGGFLTHVIAKGDLRRMAWVPIVSSSLVFPALMTFLFAQSQAVSLVALAVGSFLIPCFQAPTLTMLHATLQPNMRSLGTAVAFVSANLGGLGFGPLITGALSDAFHVSSGADSIRYALVLPASFSMIAMLFFILASRRIAADAERAEAATREA